MNGLLIIFFCSLLFIAHFALHKLIADDSNQFYVLAVFVLYCGTILYDLTVTKLSIPIFVRHFMVSSAIISSCIYVSQIIRDKVFSILLYVLYGAIAFITFKAMFVWIFNHSINTPKAGTEEFLPAIVVCCVTALLLNLIFLLIRWKKLSHWNHILLCSIFFMNVCFTIIESLLIVKIHSSYYLSIGIIAYMIIYEICAFRMVMKDQKVIVDSDDSDDSDDESENLPQIIYQLNIDNKELKQLEIKKEVIEKYSITRSELEIIHEMQQGFFSSKEIAVQLDKKNDTIDKHIKNMMKKTNCSNRRDMFSLLVQESKNI